MGFNWALKGLIHGSFAISIITTISRDLLKFHHHHHHHHISVVELGHLLTRSSLTYPEVSSKVYHGSFCQLDSSVSLPWVIYFEAFNLHVVSSFLIYSDVFCLELLLLLSSSSYICHAVGPLVDPFSLLHRSTTIPSASCTVLFHYPG